MCRGKALQAELEFIGQKKEGKAFLAEGKAHVKTQSQRTVCVGTLSTIQGYLDYSAEEK